MPVDNKHQSYADMVDDWQTCRDVSAGQKQVHSQGSRYLPILPGMVNDSDGINRDYLAYKARALFYNATSRTVDGMKGLIFRKDPTYTMADAMEEAIADITLTGKTLRDLSADLVGEVFAVGRIGILVDWPAKQAEPGMTVAQAEALALRPKWATYLTESIINWKYRQVHGQTVLSMVVLHEMSEEPVDEFSSKEVEQIRVLDLDEANLYRQRLYVKDSSGWALTETVLPTMNNARMDRIPFFFITPDGNDAEPCKPPIMDLVYVNISHYQSTADYEHGCHYTGLPTPWATGVQENEIGGLGPNEMWAASNENAKFGLLEFSGQGLGALETNLRGKEEKMAALGAEMLTAKKMAAETEASKKMDQNASHSVVGTIAGYVSQGIEAALALTAEWMGAQVDDLRYELNRDYAPEAIDPTMITALLGALQMGQISHETFWKALQKGELADPERTSEEELELAENNVNLPTLLPEEEPLEEEEEEEDE